MDGRWFTVIFLLIVPSILIGATVVWFASNPIAILVEIGAMVLGAFYLLTYTDTFP
ncbi:MAG: hypothetical protein WBF81_07180 [Thermoplasmata archaeon]